MLIRARSQLQEKLFLWLEIQAGEDTWRNPTLGKKIAVANILCVILPDSAVRFYLRVRIKSNACHWRCVTHILLIDSAVKSLFDGKS